MGRSPCCEKAHTNKGAWTKEEDDKLVAYIRSHGEGCWRSLPKAAGLLRCGKSCRLRWINYLRPDLKRGNFTEDEDEVIIKLHSLLGNKWSLIAGRLPGRTDNEIKNYWNTHIRRKLLNRGIDPATHRPISEPPTTTTNPPSPHDPITPTTIPTTPPPPPPPPTTTTTRTATATATTTISFAPPKLEDNPGVIIKVGTIEFGKCKQEKLEGDDDQGDGGKGSVLRVGHHEETKCLDLSLELKISPPSHHGDKRSLAPSTKPSILMNGWGKLACGSNNLSMNGGGECVGVAGYDFLGLRQGSVLYYRS
ncbi:hypothetical protein MLD38_032354 [Melastoma candidum]|uniref:Uncharacterized protein n=1 Tax=Melastoma candidum TaxID=119954 RepID=A0ACB9M5M3_9MYRT|nr:hypothetical protein MLD38_032354 [Melastoma candidum]